MSWVFWVGFGSVVLGMIVAVLKYKRRQKFDEKMRVLNQQLVDSDQRMVYIANRIRSIQQRFEHQILNLTRDIELGSADDAANGQPR